MTKIEHLVDDFPGIDLDPQWSEAGSGVAVYGSALHIQLTHDYGQVYSTDYWSLTESEFVVNWAMPGIGQTREVLAAVEIDTDHIAGFLWTGGVLYAYHKQGTLITYEFVTYDESAMSWVRLTETNGSLHWWYGRDGASWTQLRQLVHNQNYSNVRALLSAGFWGIVGGSTGYGGGIYGGAGNLWGVGLWGVGLWGGGSGTDDGLYGGVSGEPPDEVQFISININNTAIQPSPGVPPVVPVVLPIPIGVYRWAVGPWRGVAPEFELLSATGCQLNLHLKSASTAQFIIDGREPDAFRIDPLLTDLWVMRSGEYLFRGRITALKDEIADTGLHTVTADVADYRGILDRRYVDATRDYTTSTHDEVIRALIDDMQDQLGGNLGITYGTWNTSGPVEDISFEFDDTISDSIDKVLGMDTNIDLLIDENKVATLTHRGVDNGVVLDYGGNVIQATRTFDTSKFANIINQTGNSGTTPVVIYSPDLATSISGRWESHFSDTALLTNAMVSKTANSNYLMANKLLPTYSLTLGTGQWHGPGHVWLGDTIQVVIKSGRLQDVLKMRVYDITITIDDNGVETVVVNCGDPKYDLGNLLRGIQKRIQALVKRG